MKKIALKSLIGIALIAGILASAGFDRPGAHSIQVYLDDELFLERYVDTKMEVARLQLDPNGKHEKLNIHYSECGRTVSGRKITVKDAESKELKVWRFDGTTAGFKDVMSLQIKDLLALRTSDKPGLQVWYSSNDFPEGVHVLNVVRGNNSRASLR